MLFKNPKALKLPVSCMSIFLIGCVFAGCPTVALPSRYPFELKTELRALGWKWTARLSTSLKATPSGKAVCSSDGKYPSIISMQNLRARGSSKERKGPSYKDIPFANSVNGIDLWLVSNVAPLAFLTIVGSSSSANSFSSFMLLTKRSKSTWKPSSAAASDFFGIQSLLAALLLGIGRSPIQCSP